MTRPGRSLRLGLVLALLAGVLATVIGSPAGAYPGAPWFEPGKPYDDNFPDPSIVVGDDRYYAYGAPTGGAYLPVMTSTDLVTWTARPAYDPGAPLNQDPFFNDALPYPARWGADRPVGGRLTKELWAPGAAKIGNQWLVYYSVRMPGGQDRFCISVATGSSPLGPFTDDTGGPLVCDADPNGSIDPQPFVDTDGTPYLLWKSEGVPGSVPTRIWVRQLDPSGGGFAPGSTAGVLLVTSAPWEGNVVENPSMVRHHGQLFLFYSGNEHLSDRYAVGYAACDAVTGPCHKQSTASPLLASAGNRLGPGGPAAFVDLAGRLQMAYHWWNAPYSSYPTKPGCDGTDPKTGAPYCVSQGQRRMSVVTLAADGHRLTVLGEARPPAPPPRDISDACPSGVTDAGFGDVAPTDVHHDAIDCVAWWSVAQGVRQGAYEPRLSVDRGQMATFIARLLGEAGVELPENPPNEFADDDDSIHADNIDTLAAIGVVAGRDDGTYGPTAPVNRAQMATYLARASAEAGVPLARERDVFPDDDGSFHEASIDAAAAAGLTGGRADGTYGPGLAVQRGQMASFLARLLDLLIEEGVIAAR
ncbi:MAG: family 43 glycosylhydrolase [Acidimicrobiales bacterium]